MKEEPTLFELPKVENGFDELWRKYPRKRGRFHALKHYEAHIAAGVRPEEIKLALENYLREMRILGTDDQHTLHGSTFFYHGWEDYKAGEWEPPNRQRRRDDGLDDDARRQLEIGRNDNENDWSIH